MCDSLRFNSAHYEKIAKQIWQSLNIATIFAKYIYIYSLHEQ